MIAEGLGLNAVDAIGFKVLKLELEWMPTPTARKHPFMYYI